jgi:hypothetical protein
VSILYTTFFSFLSYKQFFVVFFHPLYNFIFLFFSWVSFQGVLEAVVVNIYACEVQNHLCARVVAFPKYGHTVVKLGLHPPPFPKHFQKIPTHESALFFIFDCNQAFPITKHGMRQPSFS